MWTSFLVSLVKVTPALAREYKLPNELLGDISVDVKSGSECSSLETLIESLMDAMIACNMN